MNYTDPIGNIAASGTSYIPSATTSYGTWSTPDSIVIGEVQHCIPTCLGELDNKKLLLLEDV